ncbi:1-deoxy-D-xylulose-5-phosphate synthase [Clostridium acetobutylicum]|uniref:1-deoxy-D-xylulose-5-phosphate synthase n=1 Tax=Clostridium acetobutylicum (strain ATCC 824 / DSM 792 / JCM 1419 / IAM 19013 / LMG 5710 / NBRC 13948 / NRRL B-527 / VKM B-1787 / 2291 / W) TaxID=272562 RepID=DXS_CLOAB|nr:MULTISPECIES: 1-deoxy-D-xylulose-5-phosphate synthase [Clostridium]Q97HD5.1 RecName: Full=1-deoxy-D-xylulose-5-phosphate synthase; AltName: Full=1-deoxyxylulose-5-phosphate synthase; Short=DXP synthase; Short=DXPS [Clostridium acetobutylicum ATCC 824]AAK80036.1 Deoxyxylulose-5-phosphate synthase [Clostridium acetobutylicum ATCC 824]ADZ21128.1 1-deoxy-D-xylulose-5-phosphate synthase [Clostridium acetobutylicum EA 2018]AEI33593.1 1-deoxy-D-xylulose-5-phosphate synthase [Clostridium acetobutyli
MYNILDNYEDVDDIKNMSSDELKEFASEIRKFLIDKISKTGGHLASNLGVVELTLSLHKVFNLKKDKIIWDVGHQAYVHKILTGRKDKFDSLKQFNGLSGFPKRNESIYDAFETGHSSTSISAASGIARARDLSKDNYDVIAVIGDGALTGGMALEALNDIGYKKTNVIIILNDNQMSIAKNVGSISKYLNKIRLDPKYNKLKKDVKTKLQRTNIGSEVANSIERIKGGIKQMVVSGMFFEDIGIKYLGPIDGHNIEELTSVISKAKEIKGPVILHVKTQKGKGYSYAEENPNKFHSIGKFNSKTGEALSKPKDTYSKAFGKAMVQMAENNDKIVAITAAMTDGTGLCEFSKKFPQRFFDVGISEQHAVTMAAGLAATGYKPVFAVYSTFLQRAYDQVLHDVCIQKLPVVFAIDRAGIVGEDGETHQGVFDISYLSSIPNMTIMAPKCVEELNYIMNWAVKQNYPIAVRYPKGGNDISDVLAPLKEFRHGKWEILKDGKDVAIVAVGKMVQRAMVVRDELLKYGIDCAIINATFIKPIDKDTLNRFARDNYKFVVIEDNVLHGGIGSLILEHLNDMKFKNDVLNLGFKDEFITHGNIEILYKLYDLDIEGICKRIISFK